MQKKVWRSFIKKKCNFVLQQLRPYGGIFNLLALLEYFMTYVSFQRENHFKLLFPHVDISLFTVSTQDIKQN